MGDSENSNGAGIFEKIITKEVPAVFIYEDDDVVSFLDIKPNNKGHALVVPTKKFRNLYDGDPEVLGKMIKVAQLVANAQRAVLNADGGNLIMNIESAGGQDVFHAHMHIIPRFEGDNMFKAANHVTYEDGEIEEVGERLRSKLI